VIHVSRVAPVPHDGRVVAETVPWERPVRCPYCDKRVPEDSVLCPVCGFAIRGLDPPEGVFTSAVRRRAATGSPGTLWYVALSLLASALVAVIVALGLMAAEAGLGVRRERAAELGQVYYERGAAHLEEGNYLLALAEFEEAVRLAPDNGDAREQYELLKTMVGDEDASSSGAPTEALLSLYGEASALYAEGQWGEVIASLEQLQGLDPTYRAEEVEGMLFEAYREQSLDLLELGELEDALSLLERALELRPNDADVAELHDSLSLYMTGLSRWGVDWEKSVETFQQLHELNPDFLDVSQRLHDALVSLGDLYYEEGAWCVAESQYTEALGVTESQQTRVKRENARELCVRAIAEASPSAQAPVAPMQPVSTTVSTVSPEAEGRFVGDFVGYEETDLTAMRISVCVIDAAGLEVPGAGVWISAQGWRSDPQEAGSDGCCEFAGLTQETGFTVELTELPCVPVQITTKWGKEAQVSFIER
jgi:tetratricopeptide (TPR) repeat protein